MLLIICWCQSPKFVVQYMNCLQTLHIQHEVILRDENVYLLHVDFDLKLFYLIMQPQTLVFTEMHT